MEKTPPTLWRPGFPARSFTSFISSAATYRSSVRPVGTSPRCPHQSDCSAFTKTVGDDTIRSGSPISHSSAPVNFNGGGMSAGSPRGAPLSAHVAILAISSSLSETSPLYSWMPMSFSIYHGGIASGLLRRLVLALMALAHGRVLFVGQQGHPRHGPGPVAVLTAPLKNGGNILRERDVLTARRRRLLTGYQSGIHQQGGRNDPPEARHHPPGSSTSWCTSPLNTHIMIHDFSSSAIRQHVSRPHRSRSPAAGPPKAFRSRQVAPNGADTTCGVDTPASCRR